MKFRRLIYTPLFLAVFAFGAAAQSVQSDYAIQKNFKEQYAEYQNKVGQVASPDSMQALIEDIKSFDQQYSQHTELLNKVLYPETYNGHMKELKKSSVLALNQLQTISDKDKELKKLQTKVTYYEQSLQQANQRTDSLKRAIKQSSRDKKELAGMVREYRQSLKKRDQLILSFIDSVVTAYEEIDIAANENLESIGQKSRLNADGNALKMIRDISVENLELLQENGDKLHLQDYMRMAAVQKQFGNMWQRLGENITDVYQNGDANEMAQEVDQNINKWSGLLKSQVLASLRDTLVASDIAINNFETPKEFYQSLNSYLDTMIMQSKNNSTEALYSEYQRFRRFWSQIELEWAGGMEEAGILSNPQLATLSDKVDRWAQFVKPESNNILAYLLGASVLLAAGLGFMLMREKKGKS
jgi:hypothetical protein